MGSKFSYTMTPLAESDLDSALNYIAVELCNGKAALDLLDKVERTIDTLCAFPYSSADCECFLIKDENIRHVAVDNFYLIYGIENDKQQIVILRFRYTGMNLTALKLK